MPKSLWMHAPLIKSLHIVMKMWMCFPTLSLHLCSLFLRPRWRPDRCNRQLQKPFKQCCLSLSPFLSLHLNPAVLFVTMGMTVDYLKCVRKHRYICTFTHSHVCLLFCCFLMNLFIHFHLGLTSISD